MLHIDFLTVTEERALAAKGLAGDLDARNRVVMNIYPWICKTAKKYAGRTPHGDLVNHAIAMCLEKFHLLDLSLSTRPKTYFCTVAKRQMELMTRRDGVIVRPANATSPEISEDMKRKAQAANNVGSFSFVVSSDREGKKLELGQVLIDEKCPLPDEEARYNEEEERFYRYLKILPKRAAEIVRLRVIEEMTLEEVGDLIGVTKERVRQIQERAMEKLRRCMVAGLVKRSRAVA